MKEIMITKYVVLKESFIQSVMSDVVTFGLLTFCMWFSMESRFWSVIVFFMYFFFIITSSMKRMKGSSHFNSAEELKLFAERLIAEKAGADEQPKA